MPHLAFMVFQMMFAVITPGADHRRLRRAQALQGVRDLHACCGRRFVYDPIAHWVWGTGGWLRDARRARLRRRHRRAHHLRRLGAGRRAGARQAQGLRQGADGPARPDHGRARRRRCSGSAGSASTRASALDRGRPGRAARSSSPTPPPRWRALTWMTVSWCVHGRPSVLGAAAGAVAGLVGDHPGVGLRRPCSASILIGLGAGVVCFFAVQLSRSASASTTRWTSSACTASAASGARSRRASSPPSRSTPRAPTACSTATRSSCVTQVDRGGRVVGLLGGDDLRHPEGDRRGRSACACPRTKRCSASTPPSTARSPTSSNSSRPRPFSSDEGGCHQAASLFFVCGLHTRPRDASPPRRDASVLFVTRIRPRA